MGKIRATVTYVFEGPDEVDGVKITPEEIKGEFEDEMRNAFDDSDTYAKQVGFSFDIARVVEE